MRTKKKYDVITIDPPPPMEAAGSSLLYSVEMYALIKQRLSDGGVLQQWIPGCEKSELLAAARSIAVSFPYVKVFRSVEGWGFHFLASMKPFGVRTTPFSKWQPSSSPDWLIGCNTCSQNFAAFVRISSIRSDN